MLKAYIRVWPPVRRPVVSQQPVAGVCVLCSANYVVTLLVMLSLILCDAADFNFKQVAAAVFVDSLMPACLKQVSYLCTTCVCRVGTQYAPLPWFSAMGVKANGCGRIPPPITTHTAAPLP
jgi:hypothetical protein